MIYQETVSYTHLDVYKRQPMSYAKVMGLLWSHCSHRLHPLDVTFYSTLKGAFKKECDLYMKMHRLVRITPYDLAGLFNQAYSRVATIAVAVAGFKGTGIYPLNPNVFTDDDFCAADIFIDRQNVSIPVTENDEAGVEPSGRPTACTTSNEKPNQEAGR